MQNNEPTGLNDLHSDSDEDNYEHYSSADAVAIATDEDAYIDSDKSPGTYLLCSVVIDEEIMIDTCISPKSFIKYDYKHIMEYVNDYSMFEDDPPAETLEIVCYSEYGHIIKTPYLRLLQHKYKKYFAEKMKKINRMKSPNYLYLRAISRRPGISYV